MNTVFAVTIVGCVILLSLWLIWGDMDPPEDDDLNSA